MKPKYIYLPPIMDFASYREELANIKRAERLAAQDIKQADQRWSRKVKTYDKTAHNQQA